VSDGIDEKLARISGRLEAQRSDVRSRLEAAPQLAACLDAIKATFHGKLKWLRIGEFEQGQEPAKGVTVFYELREKQARSKRRGNR
jgi:hypothetical protein